ncbi:MAG TPA: phosphatidylserine decarboxylase family protein [Terriglobales bacterium]|nr:phosphatidylserine decarboxylase family protein [Terriglobales bacterium]
MKFAPEGYPFIAGSVLLALVLFLLGWNWIAWPALLLAIFVLNFFRDPERVSSSDPAAILSPADGRVIKVTRCQDDAHLGTEAHLISIFMSPLDVHVNRIPCDGQIADIRYAAGSFLRAYADDASLGNERNAVFLDDANGRRICFVQVAGFVARRIVCHIKPGDVVRKGERYGMIRFGSRADIYLPLGAEPQVKVGDRTTAGVTVLARWA